MARKNKMCKSKKHANYNKSKKPYNQTPMFKGGNNHENMVFPINPNAANPMLNDQNCSATTLAMLGILNDRQTRSLTARCSNTHKRGDQGGLSVGNLVRILKNAGYNGDYKMRLLNINRVADSQSYPGENVASKALEIYFYYYAIDFLSPDASNGIILKINWQGLTGSHFCVLVNNNDEPGIVDIQNFKGIKPLDEAWDILGIPHQIHVLEDVSPGNGFVDDFFKPDEYSEDDTIEDDYEFYLHEMVNPEAFPENEFVMPDADGMLYIKSFSPRYLKHISILGQPGTEGTKYRATANRKKKPKPKTIPITAEEAERRADIMAYILQLEDDIESTVEKVLPRKKSAKHSVRRSKRRMTMKHRPLSQIMEE